MSVIPGGVHCVMITPFDEHEDVDYAAFEQQVVRADKGNAAGVLVAGATGEFYSLTDDERTALVRIAKSVLPANKSVTVGANALDISTRTSNALAAKLAHAGADALLLLPPIFVAPSHDEVLDFFRSVHQASGLPIIAYNNPRRSGVTFDVNLLANLVEKGGVVALKDSSRDLEFISKARSAHSELTILTGMDTLIAPTLASGGSGVMSMAHQVLPDLVNGTYQAAARNDWAGARTGTEKLQEFYRLMYGWRGVPYAVLKYAMNYRGLAGGVPRLPLARVSGSYSREIDAFLDAVGERDILPKG